MSRYIPPHLRRREEEAVKKTAPPTPVIIRDSAHDFPTLSRKTPGKTTQPTVWNNNVATIRAAAERVEVPDNTEIIEKYRRIQAARTARIMEISRGGELPSQEELADPDYYREKQARAARIADLYYREAIGEFDIVRREEEPDEWNAHIY
jgi:hypothetical protein